MTAPGGSETLVVTTFEGRKIVACCLIAFSFTKFCFFYIAEALTHCSVVVVAMLKNEYGARSSKICTVCLLHCFTVCAILNERRGQQVPDLQYKY